MYNPDSEVIDVATKELYNGEMVVYLGDGSRFGGEYVVVWGTPGPYDYATREETYYAPNILVFYYIDYGIAYLNPETNETRVAKRAQVTYFKTADQTAEGFPVYLTKKEYYVGNIN